MSVRTGSEESWRRTTRDRSRTETTRRKTNRCRMASAPTMSTGNQATCIHKSRLQSVKMAAGLVNLSEVLASVADVPDRASEIRMYLADVLTHLDDVRAPIDDVRTYPSDVLIKPELGENIPADVQHPPLRCAGGVGRGRDPPARRPRVLFMSSHETSRGRALPRSRAAQARPGSGEGGAGRLQRSASAIVPST